MVLCSVVVEEYTSVDLVYRDSSAPRLILDAINDLIPLSYEASWPSNVGSKERLPDPELPLGHDSILELAAAA